MDKCSGVLRCTHDNNSNLVNAVNAPMSLGRWSTAPMVNTCRWVNLSKAVGKVMGVFQLSLSTHREVRCWREDNEVLRSTPVSSSTCVVVVV